MNRQTLKDRQLRVIGYIDTESNGKQTGRDPQLRVKGYYDPKTDQTKDPQLRVVGTGNLLASLVTS